MTTDTQLRDPQAIAEACAEVLYSNDPTSKKLGMVIQSVSPGHAELTMSVTKDMTNGHGICHGGYLFTMADSAFAFACNTYDQCVVAQHCTISYLSAVSVDDQLTAHAREVSKRGRNGIYDITITNQNQDAVVEFRGYSRTIKGTLLPQDQK